MKKFIENNYTATGNVYMWSGDRALKPCTFLGRLFDFGYNAFYYACVFSMIGLIVLSLVSGVWRLFTGKRIICYGTFGIQFWFEKYLNHPMNSEWKE